MSDKAQQIIDRETLQYLEKTPGMTMEKARCRAHGVALAHLQVAAANLLYELRNDEKAKQIIDRLYKPL